MASDATPATGEQIIRWIMAALVVWGTVHAIGAWTLNHDARRPLVVIVCMAAFLGFWMAMLSARRRRLAKHGSRDVADQHAARHG